jgi:hypothetical protein
MKRGRGHREAQFCQAGCESACLAVGLRRDVPGLSMMQAARTRERDQFAASRFGFNGAPVRKAVEP